MHPYIIDVFRKLVRRSLLLTILFCEVELADRVSVE